MAWNPYQPPSQPNPYQQPQQPPATPGGYVPQAQPGQPPATPGGYAPQPGQPPLTPGGYTPPPGQPGYGMAVGGQSFVPTASAGPLPLGKAMLELPKQYFKILTHPGAQSFSEEQPKAEWSIILVQLLIAGLIGTLIGFIQTSVNAAELANEFGTVGSVFGSFGVFFSGIGAVFSLIADTVYFLVVVGTQYLLAKAFKGSGNYEQQGYNFLLFYTPVAIINSLLGWIPYLGGLIVFATSIYALILNVFSIMAAHRLSGGKASGVVFIPIGVAIVLGLLFLLIFVVWIASIFHSISSPTYPSY